MVVSKKDKKKLSKLRKAYLNYVYDHYIYNALLAHAHDETERYELALAKSYEVKSILKTYLKEQPLSNKDYEIVEYWSRAKFDVYHIMEYTQDLLILYNTKRKLAIRSILLEDSIKGIIANAPIEMAFKVSLIPYKDIFMVDAIQVIQDYTTGLKYMEKLYEDYRKAIIRNGVLTAVDTYEIREVCKRDNENEIGALFLDFIGPYNTHILDKVNLKHLCTLAVLAWNAATIKGSKAARDVMEDDKAFFQILKTRKRKYFLDVHIVIRSYQIMYSESGFTLSLVTDE